jgi:hypothetical protein
MLENKSTIALSEGAVGAEFMMECTFPTAESPIMTTLKSRSLPLDMWTAVKWSHKQWPFCESLQASKGAKREGLYGHKPILDDRKIFTLCEGEETERAKGGGGARLPHSHTPVWLECLFSSRGWSTDFS